MPVLGEVGKRIQQHFKDHHVPFATGDAADILEMFPAEQQDCPQLLELMDNPLVFSQDRLISLLGLVESTEDEPDSVGADHDFYIRCYTMPALDLRTVSEIFVEEVSRIYHLSCPHAQQPLRVVL